jgi:hypothetical protein
MYDMPKLKTYPCFPIGTISFNQNRMHLNVMIDYLNKSLIFEWTKLVPANL